ncbi:MAG: signal recognition particle-docking protein FtsY [Eubacterium aggregans]|uniref:signal recognition particle-docking protein FtsY n=1 Tax=Eubacterium aggregans TaxID=81409 RepID=UPI0023F0DEC8|nr:signal recognition particle-docking protein FtsY [Eubacterium aggregans]MDD4690771.1 signal recognition particle-docking protein FtsY [Eubacterium aggregans]MEA5072733.1 signal recognition particle-docking protein FtsY [Eubacterium aggregans]
MSELTLYERMRNRLQKTKDSFKEKIENVMYYGKLDDDFFEELEENLILADMGMETSLKIVELLKERIKEHKISDSQDAVELLKGIMSEMVETEAAPMTLPVIITVVGVNGVGKTTTIAKLAQRYLDEGKKVMVAAADTFRAAAAEQLEEWAGRIGVDIVKSNQGADPSSVVFDAIGAARARGIDILICDTAGRLHNKVNLMKELEKVTRIIEREGEGFDVHNILVLDATTGQNALIQARTFNDAVKLDGIIMTKMDGSAKGGVVIPIIDELKVPIEYVGIGEKPEDLITFDVGDFVRMLYEKDDDEE